ELIVVSVWILRIILSVIFIIVAGQQFLQFMYSFFHLYSVLFFKRCIVGQQPFRSLSLKYNIKFLVVTFAFDLRNDTFAECFVRNFIADIKLSPFICIYHTCTFFWSA